ncbi:MAG TPA: YqiA/YcfP family alpha/beta fold hydrolase, partial [Candidatus Megaira endosymbiont of Hartmannula sinica]|nr:YqiA/YcfP family alpha/beta fold hydrolase [Candidatus Megaera endosymbiont of Hartmannula sinica]
LEQGISDWIYGLNVIIDKMINDNIDNIYLVGSSMGGWISMLAYIDRLKSLNNTQKIKGLLLLAPAFNFTEELIWNKLSRAKQNKMMKEGYIEYGEKKYSYNISFNLIKDGRKYLTDWQNIKNNININIIHGTRDNIIPYQNSIDICNNISSNKVILSLIKGGDHSLSKNYDLDFIAKSCDNLIKTS